MKTKYVVMRQVKGGERKMFTTYDYQKALAYYNQHPQAKFIQKYHSGITAGILQPNVPHQVKVKGKTFTRAYMGGHNKKTATTLVNGFKKGGNESFARKTTHGYQVFVHLK